MGELFDKLANYGNSGIYPFHMPGLKDRKRLILIHIKLTSQR